MEGRFIMSSSPHLRHEDTTSGIMLDVVIALMPACIAGTYFFGARVILVIMSTVLACVVTEFLCAYFLKRKQTIRDLSAVVTGVLLGLNLPPLFRYGWPWQEERWRFCYQAVIRE